MIPDFLLAAEELNTEHISKQKGYVSSNLLVDGEIWADTITFETMEDVKAFIDSSSNSTNEFAEKFYSFINFNSCTTRCFSVEKHF